VYAIGQNGFVPLTGPGGALTGTLVSEDNTLPFNTYLHHAIFLAEGVAPLSNGPSTSDRKGGVWLTTTNRGTLWHYSNGQFTTLEHPFGSTWITTLHVDQSDRLWAANLYGELAVYDRQQWRMIATPGIGTVNRIADAPNGRLWFAGPQGVAVYDLKLDL
jgi:ligand-binding sensor domain-containing protein